MEKLWQANMDMCNLLEDAIEVLTSEKRFKDLFKIACTAYLKWSDTPKDDSNGETQGFCITVDDMWQKVYDSQDESITHKAMLTGLRRPKTESTPCSCWNVTMSRCLEI